MLRISFSGEDPAGTIHLEGKLLAPWIDEVRAAATRAAAEGEVRIDLHGLTFADQAGVGLLQQLTTMGATIEGASPFILELLASSIRQIR